MYLGFSIGSALGAGIIGLDALWAIGIAAAVAEAISLTLNYLFVRK
jgi:hypothetical protein